jgi:glc operon protein GlcG
MFPFRIALVFVAWLAAPALASAQDKQPLVTRDRVQLNLAGAERVLESARKKAAALGLKCNIAIVDDGGHLLAFARMDGARPASAATAMTKAVSAATFRQETGPLPARGEPDLLLSLSLQNAAAASGGKITTLKGGVPIVVDGQVVGAIGVGGGTGEQDVEVAKTGIQTLLDELKGKMPPE